MIVTILEAARSSTPKGSLYTWIILLTLAALLLAKMIWFAGSTQGDGARLAKMIWFAGSTQGDGARPLVDFDMFHLVGQMIWRGELHLAYRFETLVNAQRTVTGCDAGRLSGRSEAACREHLPLVLFTTFPALTITIACGQNGFLTGMLIGLACLGLK
jgi:carbon starvation protein CstA